jgi:hypothetical protein
MTFDHSMSTARNRFARAGQAIRKAYAESDLATGEQVTPDQLVDAIEQLLEILERNPADDPTEPMREEGEAEKVGNHAMDFLHDLTVYTDRLGLEETTGELQMVAVAVAMWLASWEAPIRTIELAVNGLGQLANNTGDPQELGRILGLMDRLVDAAGPEARADLETTNPYRAWRILLLNRGIVAVRAGDADGVRRAFAAIRERLPEDADPFFREAQAQVQGGEHPRAVVEAVAAYADDAG